MKALHASKIWPLLALIAGLTTLASGAATIHAKPNGLARTPFARGLLPASIVAAPPFGAYLGAQVNPSGITKPTEKDLESATETLEGSIGRPLAFHLQYRSWSAMATISTDYGILEDIAHHRVPVISWTCGDDIQKTKSNLVQIATPGSPAQGDLLTIKSQLAKLVYPGTKIPYPVMIRYFWEFNINAIVPTSKNQQEAGANGNGGCFVGTNPAKYPGQFQSAWRAIRNIFEGSNPLTNVTYAWNPNITDYGSHPDPAPFYPGAAYVDWIGIDGYNKEAPSNNLPPGFEMIFLSMYEEFLPAGKPFMVGETGSCQQYTGNYSQPLYLQSIEKVLPGSKVGAINYFDAPGAYNPASPPDGKCSWSFGPDGLKAFKVMGALPFFSPTVTKP
jgi:hypothetical protein